MDFYGTIENVVYSNDYIVLRCMNGAINEKRPWYVHLAPTNYFICPGDAIDIVSDVAYWTTLQAEAAARVCKPNKARAGRELLENVTLELRSKPWFDKKNNSN